jgi:hypothetical protein
MSANTDTTPQAEPSTQVIYAADVAVKFWPDGTTTAEVLIREEEPEVLDTDGSVIRDPHDPQNSAHSAAIDAIAGAEDVLRESMPLPLGGAVADEHAEWILAVAESAMSERLEWLNEWGGQEAQHYPEGWLEEQEQEIDEAMREIARLRGVRG